MSFIASEKRSSRRIRRLVAEARDTTVVIPAGSRALGTVVQVERGGKFKQTARLGIPRYSIHAVIGAVMLTVTIRTESAGSSLNGSYLNSAAAQK